MTKIGLPAELEALFRRYVTLGTLLPDAEALAEGEADVTAARLVLAEMALAKSEIDDFIARRRQ